MKKKICGVITTLSVIGILTQSILAAYVTDPNSVEWSSNDVVSIYATDNIGISGITYTKENIQPGNDAAWVSVEESPTPQETGSIIDAYKATFTFSNDSSQGDSNGVYYAWAKDNTGNISDTGVSFEIAKIDDNAPEVSTRDLEFSIDDITEQCIDITPEGQIYGGIGTYVYLLIDVKDSESGIKSIKVEGNINGVLVERTSSETLTVDNGLYVMKFDKDEAETGIITVTDNVGNISTTSFSITADNFDTSAPVISSIELDTLNYVNRDIIATVNATDNLGELTSIQYSIDGVSYQDNNEFTISENGDYTFYVKDSAGNISSATKTVSNIDKSAPNIDSVIIKEN